MAGYDRRPALAEPAPLLTGAAHAAVQRVVERSLSRHMVRADVIGVTAHPLGRDDEGIGVESDSICWLAHTATLSPPRARTVHHFPTARSTPVPSETPRSPH